MIFSPVQILLTILAVTLGTMLTRFLPVPAVPQQQQNAKVYSLSRKSAALCGDGHAGCLLPAQRILYHSAFRRAGSACVGLRGGPAPLEEEYAFKHWSRYDPLYGAHPVRLYMNRAASDAVKTAPPVLCESTPAQCKSAALPARRLPYQHTSQSARQKENRPLGKAFDRADGLKTGGNTFPHFSAPRRKVK